MGVLSEAPIFIDDSPLLSVLDIRTKARRLQAEQGLGMIIVDYLQLMESKNRGGNDFNRVQEVSDISRGLKALARELNLPVVALSQLSRAVESRPDKRPMLSDLRESGCLAADTLIYDARDGTAKKIKDLVGRDDLECVSVNESGNLVRQKATKIFLTGTKEVFEIQLRSGKKIKATANHKFLTISTWKRLDDLTVDEKLSTIDSSQGLESVMHYDAVQKIVPLGKEDVYDIEMPNHHNFIANDIVVHNSIEQDADVVMFIYREDYYDPQTENKGLTQILVRKHRNGPTGEVDLFFHPELRKFTTLERKRAAE